LWLFNSKMRTKVTHYVAELMVICACYTNGAEFVESSWILTETFLLL
jgi:hypothetical protein